MTFGYKNIDFVNSPKIVEPLEKAIRDINNYRYTPEYSPFKTAIEFKAGNYEFIAYLVPSKFISLMGYRPRQWLIYNKGDNWINAPFCRVLNSDIKKPIIN